MLLKQEIIYEIYVRSFADSNFDGIGDIKGIISKLDYLSDLGVTAIWLTPIFLSPNHDGGYDIEDYYTINPEYGSLNDLLSLISEAHKKNIKVLLDMVLNHCSNKHRWFLEALKNKRSKYRRYFYFQKTIPNNLGCQFESSAWHQINDEYYLGLFSQYQPDLNWENPSLRKELLDIIEHYLLLGIDGFRFDVLSLIKKPKVFSHIETNNQFADYKSYSNYPGIEEYLSELSSLLNKYQAISIVEGCGLSLEDSLSYYKFFTYVLTFDLMNLDGSEENKWNLNNFDIFNFVKTLLFLEQKHYETTPLLSFIQNHDQPRIISRFGTIKYKDKFAILLACLAYFTNGSALLYQGEEIGLENSSFNAIDQLNDIESINAYYKYQNNPDIWKIISLKSRDNARSLLDWKKDISPQINNKDSILAYYKQIIYYKKLYFNKFIPLKQFKLTEKYLSYNYENYVFIGNLTDNTVPLENKFHNRKIIFSSYSSNLSSTLNPYEFIILEENTHE